MGEDFSLSTLEHLLIEQEERLIHDKLPHERRPTKSPQQFQRPNSIQSSDHNGKSSIVEKNKKQSSSLKTNQPKESSMVRSLTRNHVVSNSREIEKDKLINILSKPQTNQSVSNKKTVNKVEPPTNFLKNTNFSPNDREREKDRLAEIFASSNYQYQKPSSYQVSKNLNSEIGQKSNKETVESTYYSNNNNSNSVFDQYEKSNETGNPITQEKTNSDIQKHNIPNILVSEFEESHKASIGPEDKTMVRIGEYSPLNSKVPPSRPELGVGEYEERRRMVLEQRKQEYNQYLQQIQETSSAFQPENIANSNCQLRDMATQTEWEAEAIPNLNEPRSPRQSSNSPVPPAERNQLHCASSVTRHSPLPRCFDGLSEKEIKENLYREELRKQIEEKNRLKEEEREKEEEEEAKIDAKIQKDLEKMRRQFEEERLQRLELAIRRKEQDDLLRQRLAFERKSFQDKRKQLLTDKSTSPLEISTRRPVGCRFAERQQVKSLSHSPSISCASKALNDVHEVLRQPLIEIQDQLPTPTVSMERNSALGRNFTVKPSTSSQPVRKAKNVDKLVHKTVLEPTAGSSSQQVRGPSPSLRPGNVDAKIREVNDMLKRPLLTESFQMLPPMSPPLLHASVPPPPPASPPIPASRRVPRTDFDHLEDRWKVPHVEHNNATPSDVFSRHNGSVLTQLGAFRRHLVQERMRMRQRVRDESP